jgi:actin-related protein
MDDELDIMNEDSNTTATKACKAQLASNVNEANSLLLSLDQAILKSIEACPTEDTKKKMYNCILIVGGGLQFQKAEKYMMQKLALQVKTNSTHPLYAKMVA